MGEEFSLSLFINLGSGFSLSVCWSLNGRRFAEVSLIPGRLVKIRLPPRILDAGFMQGRARVRRRETAARRDHSAYFIRASAKINLCLPSCYDAHVDGCSRGSLHPRLYEIGRA